MIVSFMLMELIDLFYSESKGYANWMINQMMATDGVYGNYFYFLILISSFFFVLELVMPWRRGQKIVRKDFFLDLFYLFFNFFLLNIVLLAGISEIGVQLFNRFLNAVGLENIVALELSNLPSWFQLCVLFVLKDFIEWWIHRLLHYVPFLWEFHKVHHSVKELGFASHLRFHWMESVIYKSLEYIPLAMIGFGLDDFFIVHVIAITIGHWNHANFNVNIGFLKYVINNPAMHVWHHAKNLPSEKNAGVNFGISLSTWDYIFGTSYIPKEGRDEVLGFENDDKFPTTFIAQETHGFRKQKD